MLQATNAQVGWDPAKKHWQLRIHVGAEVIKRTLEKVEQNAAEDRLRSLAITTAKDEGYELDPAKVAIST